MGDYRVFVNKFNLAIIIMVCIVKQTGIGVAFCSKSNILISVADKVIDTHSFKPILDFAL